MKSIITLFCILISLTASAAKEITWWHSMSGSRGDVLREMVDKYNKSQSKFKVNAIYKGNYTESLNASIAAYRGKKQPHIVQVFEVGTLTMMNSGAIYPVHKLMKDTGHNVDWDGFLQPVLSYYTSASGDLLSMPFNSSTPVMYFNKDLLKKAGIKNPPKTWEQLYKDANKLIASGAECGAVVGWQSWVLIENFSAIHDTPLASNGNGFEGVDTKLMFDNDLVSKNIEKLQAGLKTKVFSYEGRRSDPARTAFLAGKCAFHMDSSSSYSSVKKLAKFNFGVSSLPHNEGVKPRNSIIGGATLWVFKGHKDDEYKGVADFFNFLSGKENQAWWHKATGYLPITKESYQMLKAEKFYNKEPAQEIAIKQLMRGKPSKNSRGIRLGSFTQIRDVINEELEKIWAGKVSAKDGLKKAVSRGNALLKRYARSVKRRR